MAKVQSPTMLCILCPGDESVKLVVRALADIDVVEKHKLDDGFTVLVVGVDSLPPMLAEQIDGYSWSATYNQRALEQFLHAVNTHGTKSIQAFRMWSVK